MIKFILTNLHCIYMENPVLLSYKSTHFTVYARAEISACKPKESVTSHAQGPLVFVFYK